MELKKLHYREIGIPFKLNFKHSLADRSKTETVLVIAKSSRGNTGYGEGCPRSYVTGETLNSAIKFINTYEEDILKISSLTDLESFVISNKWQIDLNPSAWCAVEIALLDLMGKEEGQPIERLLSLPRLNGNFEYSAVIGDWDPETAEKYINKYLEMQFEDFKIKLSGDFKRDLSKLNLLKHKDFKKIRIRLDANKLWTGSKEAYDYLTLLNYSFTAVEEPLREFSYDDLVWLSNKLKTFIILDESFTRSEDFEKIQNGSDKFIINIRISKMGGILRSLRVAERAVAEGFNLVIGSQVGETSILSRAALAVACKCRVNIMSQEGAFGDYLLLNDICSPSIKFNRRGVYNVKALTSNGTGGLGLKVQI